MSTLLDLGYTSIASLHFSKYNRDKKEKGRKRYRATQMKVMHTPRSESLHPKIITPPPREEVGASPGASGPRPTLA